MIYLAQYSTHQSVEDMEKSVTEHIRDNYNKLTDAGRKVLTCLKEYSKLHLGACHVKADTIAEKTFTSRRTVMRQLKKLVDLDIIEKVNRTKLNGIKGASIYTIMPYDVTSEWAYQDTSNKPHEINVCGEQNKLEYIKSFNLLKTSTLQEIYNSI